MKVGVRKKETELGKRVRIVAKFFLGESRFLIIIFYFKVSNFKF